MPWFKVDDSFESHPKVKAIPRARRPKAIGLWTLAGSWAARQLTDGFVPSYMLDELASTKTEANTLVEVGLWSPVDGGYLFKDWHDWQPTKAKVEAERDAAKERMRVARERKKGTRSGDVRANTSATSPNVRERSPEVRSTPRSVTPTRPDPTRPDPEEEQPSSDKSNKPDPLDRFDEFWDTYAKKVNRKAAEGKWRLALKRVGVTPDLLIEAARAYVTWERTNNEGGRYVMDPAKWLNGHRWEDERPARPEPQTNTQRHMALVRELAEREQAQSPIPFPQIGGDR